MLAFAALKIDLLLPASKLSLKINSQQVPSPPFRQVSRVRPLFPIKKYRNKESKHLRLVEILELCLVVLANTEIPSRAFQVEHPTCVCSPSLTGSSSLDEEAHSRWKTTEIRKLVFHKNSILQCHVCPLEVPPKMQSHLYRLTLQAFEKRIEG